MSQEWIFDDVGQEHSDIVGKKCANLGEMRRAGIRVPHGFALSLRGYEKFMKETGAVEKIRGYLAALDADPDNPADISKFDRAAETIRGIVESKGMPGDMEAAIAQSYGELCMKSHMENVPVAVRSAGRASHPGQYETFLHVSGTSGLMENIIKVWSSTFNSRSLIAHARSGLPLESDPIGVAVLQMVNAGAAGVMFTLNPVTGDTSKISIGSNWGLGEAVVSGEVTNDQWTVDKVTLEIIDRTIARKTIECVFDPETGETVNREIPPERQFRPCLTDEELLELAKQAKRIEKHFGEPQDIEWAIDKGLSFPQGMLFLQARPETIWGRQEESTPLLATKKKFGEYDLLSFLNKD
jgi:pyruvate,water dikinase